MELKLILLNIFPPLRELEKEYPISILLYNNRTSNEYLLSDLFKSKQPIKLSLPSSNTPTVSFSLKQNKHCIASISFIATIEDIWLQIFLDKSIKFKGTVIDSIKIQVKCHISNHPNLKLSHSLPKEHKDNDNSIMNQHSSRERNCFSSNGNDDNDNNKSCMPQKKKTQLNMLIKDLLNNPLLNSTISNNPNLRNKSIDSNSNRQMMNSQHDISTTTDQCHNKQINTPKRKAIQIQSNLNKRKQRNHHREISRKSNNQLQIKRLILHNQSLPKLGYYDDLPSSTRESIPDSNNTNTNTNTNSNTNANEINLMRQKLEDTFNDLINKDKLLTQNDSTFIDIQVSPSELIDDIIMEDDDDIQLSYEDLYNQFNNYYTEGYFEQCHSDMLRTEYDVLIYKVMELNRMYHANVNEGLKKYYKHRELFMSYSEMFLNMNNKVMNIRHDNEEMKVRKERCCFEGEDVFGMKKINRREMDLFGVLFNAKESKMTKQKGKKEEMNKRLSEIIGIVYKKKQNLLKEIDVKMVIRNDKNSMMGNDLNNKQENEISYPKENNNPIKDNKMLIKRNTYHHKPHLIESSH